MKLFLEDYPEAKGYILFGGKNDEYHNQIQATSYEKALKMLPELMGYKKNMKKN